MARLILSWFFLSAILMGCAQGGTYDINSELVFYLKIIMAIALLWLIGVAAAGAILFLVYSIPSLLGIGIGFLLWSADLRILAILVGSLAVILNIALFIAMKDIHGGPG